MIKLGREEPAMSMDANGKIIWAKHSEVQQANLKALPGMYQRLLLVIGVCTTNLHITSLKKKAVLGYMEV